MSLSLQSLNIVHPTELGNHLREHFMARLALHDLTHALSDHPELEIHDSRRVLGDLQNDLATSQSLDGAVDQIRDCPYFKPYLDPGRPDKGEKRKVDGAPVQAVMIEQVRNRVPADVSIVYRHPQGEHALEAMFRVSASDPVGPVVTDERIVPCGGKRTGAHTLQRYCFDLYELACESQLIQAHTYRAIFNDLRSAWTAIPLSRNKEFTWVMYFWYRRPPTVDAQTASRAMRSGFELLAETLALCFEKERANAPTTFCEADSLSTGRLVLLDNFTRLFTQNFAAQAMLQGLTRPNHPAIPRASIYQRIAQEAQRRFKKGAPLRWEVEECFHPVASGKGLMPALDVRVLSDHRPLEQRACIELRELSTHCPYLPPLPWWNLPQHRGSGLGKALRDLPARINTAARVSLEEVQARGDDDFYHLMQGEVHPGALYKPELRCIARPVWDVDVVAGRLAKYPEANSTQLNLKDSNRKDKKGNIMKALSASDLKIHPLWRVTYYDRIVGVLQPI